ncbi:hypothetical protein Ahy_B05g078688 isoform D [Arachis hypogaea]|uniref:Uncharacterized protein n=1 Tax=Arachis hypogaea TaxID=3818 RepID=A0A444Z7V6_ARAHY|nr:hypothetical protein Ahy_B05g078688 isoform D [Arachis hypogaea]
MQFLWLVHSFHCFYYQHIIHLVKLTNTLLIETYYLDACIVSKSVKKGKEHCIWSMEAASVSQYWIVCQHCARQG